MPTLFDKMKKELEIRLNHSEFHNKTLSLTVKTGKEATTFLINDGEITVSTEREKADYTLEAPFSSLNSLVTGYKSIHELIEKKEATINSNKAGAAKNQNCIRLVGVLFPKGTPYDGNLPLVWE